MKGEWVTVGPEPWLATCGHCGAHEPKPALPCDLEAFATYLKYVAQRHANCKPGDTPA